MADYYDCRDAFARELERLAAEDPRVIALANDSIGSSKLALFGARFPGRLINVGIAEQNMVGMAAGLANGGKLPFVCSASSFMTARALEQIKVDLAYGRADVKLCGMSPGLAYGALGATHHAIEDVAWLRAIAGMTVIVPADPIETEQAVRAAAQEPGPVFLRISRMPVPGIHAQDYRFRIGHAVLLRAGSDVTLIANGTMVSRALEAAGILAGRGVQARVLNMATVSPIDREAIAQAAAETGAIVTVEEHSIRGGLGSAVAECVVTERPVPMRLLGVPGVFAPTGPTAWLLEHYGLTGEGIARATCGLLEEVNHG